MLPPSQSALAADLPSRKASLLTPAPVWSWTGFYVGANAGVNILQTAPYFTGGVGGGYNYQFQNNVVLGVETDVNFRPLHNDRHSIYVNPFGTVFTNVVRNDTTLVNTVRGRVGYAFGRYLPYFTGGLVYGDFHASHNEAVTSGGAFRNYVWYGDHTWLRTGWTLGGGLEYAFTDHITFKGEYLYYKFERVQVTSYLNVTPGRSEPGPADTGRGHIARIGVNYKF